MFLKLASHEIRPRFFHASNFPNLSIVCDSPNSAHPRLETRGNFLRSRKIEKTRLRDSIEYMIIRDNSVYTEVGSFQRESGRIGESGRKSGSVVSVALALLMGTQAGKEKHEMNIQKLLVCSEM